MDWAKTIIQKTDTEKRSRYNLGTFSTTAMNNDAKAIYQHYAALNGVDICAYPELLEFEQECGKTLLSLFHATASDQCQYFNTSGSSEAIFLALLLMKRYWARKKPSDSYKPNVIIGSNGHTAWQKAASFLDIELRLIPANNESFQINVQQILDNIDHNTIGVIGTLGATSTLLFDDINAINEILAQYHQQHGVFIPLHVDAASGGFIAPYYYPDLIWDFRLPQVMSINVSSHKFGMVYPSLGWLCVKGEITSEHLAHESHYLGKSIKRYPIQFSHSASHIATQYYYFKALHPKGYHSIIHDLFSLSTRLHEKLRAFENIEIIAHNGTLSLPGVVFKMNAKNNEHHLAGLASYLATKGWHLPTFKLPAPFSQDIAARIVIRYGFDDNLLQQLIHDMAEYYQSPPE